MDVFDDPKYSYLIEEHLSSLKFLKKFFTTMQGSFQHICSFTCLWQRKYSDDSFIISSNHNSHMDVALLSVATKKIITNRNACSKRLFF